MRLKYYSRVSIRDGEHTIADCLQSLIDQRIKPQKIIVVNDGSTDRTGDIIAGYKAKYSDLIDIINTGSKTRDYSRLPHLLNISISHAKPLNCDYFFSTGGDCRFAPDYIEKIIGAMEQDSDLVLASGDYGTMQASAPQGAGRVIRLSWFNKNYPNGYPEIIGYESEILERALLTGKKIAVIPGAAFEHLDRLGHSHNFKEFGYAMRALHYDPFYAVLRCFHDFCNNKAVGRAGVVKILYSYLAYRPKKEGYLSQFDPSLCVALRKRQRKIVISELLKPIWMTRNYAWTIKAKVNKRIS